MSLAEQIREGNEKEKQSKFDELGLKLPAEAVETGEWIDNDGFAQYLTARALFIISHPDDGSHYDQYSNDQPHTRDGVLYRGNQWLGENNDSFYKLTRYPKKVERPVILLFWHYLKQYVPHLNTRYFEVSETTFWDKEEGKLIDAGEMEKRIAKGEV